MKDKHVVRIALASTALAMGMVVFAAPAIAQEEGGVEAQVGGGGVADIIVTARKREERLQDTPIAVTALSSGDLERSNVQNIAAVTKLVPNVAIRQQASFLTGVTAFIRGIGNRETLMSDEAAVGIYMDGVYIGRANAANMELVDLERVEVLRGPQGTLFGRNTTGGALNMISKAPESEFGVNQKVTLASFNEITSRTRVNTGELGASGLSAVISYMHKQRDGYYKDSQNSRSHTWGAVNTDAVWAKVQGKWGDLTATYIFDWTDTKGRAPTIETDYLSDTVRQYYENTTGFDFLKQVEPGFNRSFTVGEQARQHSRIEGHALTLQYDVSEALTLKSITSRRTFKAYYAPSLYGPSDVYGNTYAGLAEVSPFGVLTEQQAKQFSQEFQLLGQVSDFSYVGGLYYFKETAGEYNPSFYTYVVSPVIASNTGGLTDYSVHSKSYAAFGQASWKPQALDEKLELTFGIRYTKDKRDVVQRASTARTGSKTFENTSINAIVSYKPVDDLMVYARYGTGYRSGGFNVRARAGQSFDFSPEKAQVYELGFKAEFLDRFVRLNAAAFRTDYKDLQVTSFVINAGEGAGGYTSSAKARFEGFEVELDVVPTRNLSMRGSVGYVNPKYKNFPAIVPATPVPGHNPDPNEVPGGYGNYADISHFPLVPKWTLSGGIQYLGDETEYGSLLLKVDASYNSRRYFNTNILGGNAFSNILRDNGSYQIDLRAGMVNIPVHGRIKAEVTAFVENLTNEHIATGGIDFGALGFAGMAYGPPRRIGLDASISF